MSATFTCKSSFGALPIKLSWQMGSTRLRFNSILATFIGPALGLDVTTIGPLIAELVYVSRDTNRTRPVSFVAKASVSDNTAANRSDWQLEMTLPKTITLANASGINVYLALPPGAKAVTDKSSKSSQWRVKYGLDGNYESA